MKRRDFIQSSTVSVAGCLLLPSFLKGAPFEGESEKKLVIIQLGGGNDGLNTFIPYRNDIYYQSRPKIGIDPNEVIKLTDEMGLNPYLKSLKPWYDQGFVSIINNVGYPNPNRSHFRSMDIWHTASAEKTLDTGWIGRYLDSECNNCPSHGAVEIADQPALALRGKDTSGMTFSSKKDLMLLSDGLKSASSRSTPNQGLDYLRKTMQSVNHSAEYLLDKLSLERNRVIPPHRLARDLSMISSLIKAESSTKIYYASHNGFDTHARQNAKQHKLLLSLGDSLSWFIESLDKSGKLNNTLIMVFSEFGRRVKENYSRGTDHGTANSVMLIGGALKNVGITNEQPDLKNLDNGDLKYTVDFRSIYKTIIDKWLEGDSSLILNTQLEYLDFI